MTKSEFIERVAEDERIGSKKEAGDAVEAVLDTIVDTLKGGGDVNFTGFGKFSVNERGPRQGVNPRTGERITIPGGKVPKFSAGAALKSAAARSASVSTPTRRSSPGTSLTYPTGPRPPSVRPGRSSPTAAA